jgi:hypothetical protein
VADRRTPREGGSGGSSRPGRPQGSGKPSGGKPASGRPTSGKPASGRPSSGKPKSDRWGTDKPRADRPSSDRPRSDRPSSGKPASGRPSGDRPSSDRPASNRSWSDKPRTDRPRTDTWGSDKPRSDRPSSDRSRSDRPSSDRSRSDRPSSDRPRSDRPSGDRSWSDKPRSDRPRSDRPSSDRSRSDRPSSDRSRSDRPRTDRQIPDRPLSDRPRDPQIPDEITAEQLDRSVLLELRTLPDGLAEIVARHLVAADLAMAADDVELAMAHIEAARRRAGRVAAVREAAGVAAYKAGKFPEAISELRTARRMTGSNAFIPMIADCERGLGRPQKALDLIKTTNTKTLDDETRAELLIVGAGARADLGQLEAAVVTLQVPELTKLRPGTARARLQYAYSDFLAQVGRTTEAWEWMERAAASDIDGATDAAERCEEFAGIAFTEEIGSPADPAND